MPPREILRGRTSCRDTPQRDPQGQGELPERSARSNPLGGQRAGACRPQILNEEATLESEGWSGRGVERARGGVGEDRRSRAHPSILRSSFTFAITCGAWMGFVM